MVGVDLSPAYLELARGRVDLLVLAHGFTSGDPEIAAQARRVLGDVYRTVRGRFGGDVEASVDFIAQGVLINVLLAVDAPGHLGEDPDLEEFTRRTCGDEVAAAAGGAR